MAMKAKTIKDTYETTVDHPPHYTQSKIQPLDVMKDWAKDEDALLYLFKMQILKYLKREKDKGQLQDIYKAERYMKELVKAAEDYYGR